MVRLVDLKLEDDVYLRLRARSEKNGGSIEDEACHILKSALENDPPPPPEKPMTGKEFVEGIRALFEPLGGVELEIPPREPMPDPPRFD